MKEKVEALEIQHQDAQKEQEQHESLQKELADQIEKTKLARDEASALKAELDENAAIREKLAEETQRADTVKQELMAANERLLQVESELKVMEDSKVEASERLQKDITDLQSALEANGKKRDTMQEENEQLLSDLDSLQTTEKEMKEQFESLESQHQDAKKEQELHESLQREHADQIEKTKSAMDEASALKAELHENATIREKLAEETQRADSAKQQQMTAYDRLVHVKLMEESKKEATIRQELLGETQRAKAAGEELTNTQKRLHKIELELKNALVSKREVVERSHKMFADLRGMFNDYKRQVEGMQAEQKKLAQKTESTQGVQMDPEKELGTEDQSWILPQWDIAAMFSDTPAKSEVMDENLSALEMEKKRQSLFLKGKLKELDLDYDEINREQEAQERLIKETLEKKNQKKQLGPNETGDKTKDSDIAVMFSDTPARSEVKDENLSALEMEKKRQSIFLMERLKELDLDSDEIDREQEAQERLIKESIEKKKQKKQLGPNETGEKTKDRDAAKGMEEKERHPKTTSFLDSMSLFGFGSVHKPVEEASSDSKEDVASTSGVTESQDKIDEERRQKAEEEEKERPPKTTSFLDSMSLFGLGSVHEPVEEASSDSDEDATSTSGNAEAKDKADEEPPQKTEEAAKLKGEEVDISNEKGENDKDEKPQSGDFVSAESATTESAEAVDAAPTAEVESVEPVTPPRRKREKHPWK
jgi:hypothetical protein